MSKKRAKTNHSPNPIKEVKTAYNPDRWFKQPIIWSFCKMDRGEHRWSVTKGNHDLIAVVEYLADVEKLGSWSKALTTSSGRRNNTRNHEINKSEMIKEAQKRLDELNFLEDSYFSFALGGKPRLWGTREGNVFCIIWLDTEHEICPSKKINT